MSSYEEITKLIARYAHTIDTGRFDEFAALFEHATLHIEGSPPMVGSDAVSAVAKGVQVYPDGTPRTKHVVGSIAVEIDEAADTASSQCYVVCFQQTDDFPLQAIYSGHYFDEFERVDGSWRFTSRATKHALVGDLSHHLAHPEAVVGD